MILEMRPRRLDLQDRYEKLDAALEVLGFTDIEHVNFEHFLSMVKLSEDLSNDNAEDSFFPNGYWDGAYRKILELVTELFTERIDNAVRRRIPGVAVFLEQLREPDCVITFNWDTLLEAAAQLVGTSLSILGSRDSGIPLLKLHGACPG